MRNTNFSCPIIACLHPVCLSFFSILQIHEWRFMPVFLIKYLTNLMESYQLSYS